MLQKNSIYEQFCMFLQENVKKSLQINYTGGKNYYRGIAIRRLIYTQMHLKMFSLKGF